uniref:alpha/beta hydrolase n=1 Tax=Trichocoleus desertorum TaxID=1481672 RepID=UPI0025B42F6E|nr:alpha/beta hydrolase [Trichocoleus desertorum]
MQIRYFATNRDRENLGRDIDRQRRIKLQKGGYHWLDMYHYMSHYLATTDTTTMPPEVIIPDSKATVFHPFLNRPAVKRIIVGVHGFNVHLHEALTSFSILADTLEHTTILGPTIITDPTTPQAAARLNDPNSNVTAFVGFSWPSNGSALDYEGDRTEAVSSATALANFIGCLRLENPSAKIHVIAHSMGNFLTCNMLQKLVNQEITPLDANDEVKKQISRRDDGGNNSFFIDRYILVAPDVERRHITQCNANGSANPKASYLGPFYGGLYHLVEESHHFYSRFDSALKMSKIEKQAFRKVVVGVKDTLTRNTSIEAQQANLWEDSLGLNPIPSVAPPNMHSHNGVTLTNREIDHCDYFDALPVAEKIAKIILSAD